MLNSHAILESKSQTEIQNEILASALYEAHLVMSEELHVSNASSLALQIIVWCKVGMKGNQL